MRVSTDLAPRRSAQRAVGISNAAYASAKAMNTQPCCALSSENSAAMLGIMAPMQARSRYVTIARVTVNAITTYRARVAGNVFGNGSPRVGHFIARTRVAAQALSAEPDRAVA